MCSLGVDKELILGYLYFEGIISYVVVVECMEFFVVDMVNVYLFVEVVFDFLVYYWVGYVNLSCGLCGKVDLD